MESDDSSREHIIWAGRKAEDFIINYNKTIVNNQFWPFLVELQVDK